jgi:hypothetical protein
MSGNGIAAAVFLQWDRRNHTTFDRFGHRAPQMSLRFNNDQLAETLDELTKV